jgi:zinc transport system substrate-binding protein
MHSIGLVLLLGLTLGLCACPASDPGLAAGDRIKVAVSILPQAEFAAQVGGDRVETVVLIPPGAQPHSYDPTPGQLSAVSAARLYAQVGSGLPFEQVWMEKIRALNPRMPVVDCAEGIQLVDSDPHIWLSPRLAGVMVANICGGLVRLDPDHRADYERNRDRYLEALAELDRQLTRTLAGLPQKKFMVYHPSWGYFARDYGLEQVAVEEEGKEPTIQSMAELVEEARRQRISTLFVSPQFDDRSARTIATELGGRVIAVDSLPRNYLETLRQFADLLSGQR